MMIRSAAVLLASKLLHEDAGRCMAAAILFWRGCILYLGRLPDLPRHAHLAAAVCAGLDGPLEIRGDGLANWTTCRTALLPSRAVHEVRTGPGRFATILSEPGASNEWNPPVDAAETSEEDSGEAPARIVPDPESGARVLEAFRELAAAMSLDPPGDLNDAGKTKTDRIVERNVPRILSALLGSSISAGSRPELDARLLPVMERLLRAPRETPDINELAAGIAMSPSWLQHNFRAQLGVPIRRFRTWFRLKASALFMQRGASLVDAAMAAGFYDQSHFSNAFREMFGIQPGVVFRGESLRWYLDDEALVSDLAERGLLHLS